MGTSMVAAANINDQLQNYVVLPNYNHKSTSTNMITMIQKNDHQQQQHGEEDQEAAAAAAAVSSPNNSSSVSCLSLNVCTTNITAAGRKRKSNKLQYSSSSSDQEPERSDQHKLDVDHDHQNIIDDDQELDGGKLKKLRLSKDQAAILEERFKENNTLNPKQKIALAKQLNLRPRQVEVWFQNRRARTKLKQTEVDCDLLRRCCENLSEENRRLQREILELRSLRHTQQLYMQQQQQLAPTTLTVCPSCDRRQAMSDAKPASHLISPWRPATAPNNIIGNQQPINIRSQAKS